jgi:inosine-uridine nucleoside N-ribohydrolase
VLDLLIDTDAGIDDLLAISFLLTQPNVNITAVTIVNGLAHPDAGAANVLRLLQLTNRLDIPVYLGAQKPLPGGTDFPEEWRKTADTLPGVTLPSTTGVPKADAVEFLADRFSSSSLVTLLALGPHTNLAEALALNEGDISGVDRMIMMGGAVLVEGNVTGHNDKKAEWNVFEDPDAAFSVFESGMRISMVPLDATQFVRIGQLFLDTAEKFTSPLGQVVFQLLSLGYASNDKDYFAWDPLAAVSVVAPSVVVDSQVLGIEIVTVPPEVGRTKENSAIPNKVQVATRASADKFRDVFLGAFS